MSNGSGTSDGDRKTHVADSARAFAQRRIGKREFLRRLGHGRCRTLQLCDHHARRKPAFCQDDRDAGPGRQRRLSGDDEMAPGGGKQIQGLEDPLRLRADAAHRRRKPAGQGRVHGQYGHRGGHRNRPAGAGAAEGDGRRPGQGRRVRSLLPGPVLDGAVRRRHRRSARDLRPQEGSGVARFRLGRLLQAPAARDLDVQGQARSESRSISRSSS